MRGLIQKLLNLSFTAKIRAGFSIIALISTLLAVNDFINFEQLKNDIHSIFSDYIEPSNTLSMLKDDFQNIEKATIKLSSKQFSSDEAEVIKVLKDEDNKVNKRFLFLQKNLKSVEFSPLLQSLQDKWALFNQHFKSIISNINNNKELISNNTSVQVLVNNSEDLFNIIEKINNLLSSNVNKIASYSNKLTSASIYRLLIGMVLGTIVFLFSFFVLAPSITKPIIKLKKIINEYALGKFDRSIAINQKDEIGELANAMRKLRDAQKEKIEAANNIAKGILTKVKPASEYDELSIAFNSQVDSIKTIIEEIDNVSRKNIEEGDVFVRTNTEELSGEWKRLTEAINKMLDVVIEPIEETSDVLASMGQGDFTLRVNGDYKGFYKKLKDDVNHVVDAMNRIFSEMGEAIQNISNSSEEILQKTNEMAAGANEQNEQSSEVASAVEEMTKTIMNNSQNVIMIEKESFASSEKAQEGGEVVNKTVEGIERIAEIVNGTASTMLELGESSQKINEVIKVINEIADQTNLLALNAAIEAARAGEQGRGFAVVADEVRRLAERTQHATKEIADMINEIQLKTKDAIEAINSSSEEVDKDKELAQKAKVSLGEIINNARNISDLISQLAAALEEESKTSEEISRSITTISHVAENNAANTGHITNTAEIMYDLTNRLKSKIDEFKINKNQNYLEAHSPAMIS